MYSKLITVVFAVFFATGYCSGQSESSPFGRQANTDITLRGVASFIPHAPGQFVSGPNTGMNIVQALRDEAGGSLEYRRWWGNYGAGITFVKTPTASTLYNPDGSHLTWRIREDQLHLFSTYRLFGGRGIDVGRTSVFPYVVGGLGAMVLNGGRNESGYDAQFLYVTGVGADFRLSRNFRWNMDYRLNRMQMPTFQDRTYRSEKVETSLVQSGVSYSFGKRWPF